MVLTQNFPSANSDAASSSGADCHNHHHHIITQHHHHSGSQQHHRHSGGSSGNASAGSGGNQHYQVTSSSSMLSQEQQLGLLKQQDLYNGLGLQQQSPYYCQHRHASDANSTAVISSATSFSGATNNGTTMPNMAPSVTVTHRDPTTAPLRKLSVDLIKTYKHINEVSSCNISS